MTATKRDFPLHPHTLGNTSTTLAATGLLDALAALEHYQEDGAFERANALAAQLLEAWPMTAAVLVEVARLYARQGRHEEAMDLLCSEHVGKNVRLLNYRMCARPLARRA
jgi:thioredoxin-like negative regulator of GroEL